MTAPATGANGRPMQSWAWPTLGRSMLRVRDCDPPSQLASQGSQSLQGKLLNHVEFLLNCYCWKSGFQKQAQSHSICVWREHTAFVLESLSLRREATPARLPASLTTDNPSKCCCTVSTPCVGHRERHHSRPQQAIYRMCGKNYDFTAFTAKDLDESVTMNKSWTLWPCKLASPRFGVSPLHFPCHIY